MKTTEKESVTRIREALDRAWSNERMEYADMGAVMEAHREVKLLEAAATTRKVPTITKGKGKQA